MSEVFDLTPSPALLKLIGQIPFKGWQCIAELVDNSIDAIINNPAFQDYQKVVSVSIPTKSQLKNNVPLVVEDWGIGMSATQLEKAVRAGFSSKNTSGLGLFGMGFNVATSRLATSVEVWSSTSDMECEVGVSIDLKGMIKSESFLRPRLTRPKKVNKKSGTEIKIFNYTPVAENLLKAKDIIENMNRAYSERIFSDNGIRIFVNDTEIKPFKFCAWDKKRTVKYKNGDIPAVIEIDQLIKKELFCENCLSWLGDVVETSLQIECPHCETSNRIVEKEISISGWVGIQRFTDTEHYGIDISRNGRILRRLDKSLFSWNKNSNNDPRLNPEYPRDTPHAGGRIVGQIEVNFVVPKYTKDDFERDDKNWQKAVDFIRGEMPLQPEIAESLGFRGLNWSSIGRLFSGYRKVSPPGAKTLIFGKADGSADYITPRNWAQKFYDGDPEYQDDSKWWDAVSKSDLKDNPSPFNPLNPLAQAVSKPTSVPINGALQQPDKYPGKKIHKVSKRFDLEKLINERPLEVTIIDYYPDIEISKPIIF